MSQTPKQIPENARFCWLTPAGASAISVVWLHFAKFQRVLGVNVASIGQTPLHKWLTDHNEQRIDEVLIARNDHSLLVTSHGGAAVREAISLALLQAGFEETPAHNFLAQSDYQAEILGILPQIRGRVGVELALSAVWRESEFNKQLNLPIVERESLATQALNFERFITPPRVQLWGVVNAGKSSLLNELSGRELARVGAQPGLTRDVIESSMHWQGFEIRIFDAPGQMPDAQGIDAAAIELAQNWRQNADLVIELVPPDENPLGVGDWVLHSKRDEVADTQEHEISMQRPESIIALKERLIAHFYGFENSGLLAITASLRAKLSYPLLDH